MRKMMIKLVLIVDARIERVLFLLREKGIKQRLRIVREYNGKGQMNERLALP